MTSLACARCLWLPLNIISLLIASPNMLGLPGFFFRCPRLEKTSCTSSCCKTTTANKFRYEEASLAKAVFPLSAIVAFRRAHVSVCSSNCKEFGRPSKQLLLSVFKFSWLRTTSLMHEIGQEFWIARSHANFPMSGRCYCWFGKWQFSVANQAAGCCDIIQGAASTLRGYLLLASFRSFQPQFDPKCDQHVHVKQRFSAGGALLTSPL